MASAPRNPDNNTYEQACLDLRDAGYGQMTIDGFYEKIHNDRKLKMTLQAKWNAHAYPEKKITWAQLTMSQHLMTLSAEALKLLIFMGMYAHQSTLLQASHKDLSALTGLKLTRLRQAIKELEACGCIRVEKASVRHSAPIYAINPALINKGTRRKGKAATFTDAITIKSDYVLQRDLPLIAQVETVYQDTADGAKITFNRLSAGKPAPAKKKPSTFKKEPDAQIPGQMTFEDFPEVMPGG